MIKINLLSTEKQELNKAVAAAREALYNRSYSGRNSHLGKMINCAVCNRRHRQVQMIGKDIIKCEIVYSTGRYDLSDDPQPLIASQTTRKGVFGSAAFAKKRLHPHPNKKGLRLVQRTQQLFPQEQPFWGSPEEAMKAARTKAQRQLKKERAAERRFKRQQQSIAHRINWGLETPGTRA